MLSNLAYWANPRTYDHLTRDGEKSRNPFACLEALNRSENQSTHLGAPEKRYERTNQAAETAETTRRPYEALTWTSVQVPS